jgi:hypothetical protein
MNNFDIFLLLDFILKNGFAALFNFATIAVLRKVRYANSSDAPCPMPDAPCPRAPPEI